MIRLNALLAVVLVSCALGLVTSQQRARKLFVDLEQAKAKEGQLQVRWNQLQLEQGALATSSLIDARARKGLSMQPAPPQRTLYLVTEPTAEPAGMAPVR
ncbi:MAG: cell division protein FtsL [Quisquiliibacterium sp.]